MSEHLYFYKGIEESLPTSNIKVGGLYHCTDTGNTYRGVSSTEYELYSSAVGKKTLEGGEIFGDYANNQATAPYSAAFGTQTLAAATGAFAQGSTVFKSGAQRLTDATGKYYVSSEQCELAVNNENNYITITKSQLEEEILKGAACVETADGGFVLAADVRYSEAHGTASAAMGQGAYAFSRSSKSFGYRTQTGYPNHDMQNSGKYDDKGIIYAPWTTLTEDEQNRVNTGFYGQGAVAIGADTAALNNHDFAGGLGSISKGGNSFAFGSNAKANASASFALGRNVEASGLNSHAEGENTIASGNNSHAEGKKTEATGSNSHAEGSNTTASGNYSHAEGESTKATTYWSHAEGYRTTTNGRAAHAEGYSSVIYNAETHGSTVTDILKSWSNLETGKKFSLALGQGSHAEGCSNLATALYSHAEGYETKATGGNSHAEGNSTVASGESSHVEGKNTFAPGIYSHAEGYNTDAYGEASHTEGSNTTASGGSSHAEGNNTTASGQASHAEGGSTVASGLYSHAEGKNTAASGNYSHAEGEFTKATTHYSHAEGCKSQATGQATHAEGSMTTASGRAAHAEGSSSKIAEITLSETADEVKAKWNAAKFALAFGQNSHIEGKDCLAIKDNSHASGLCNIAIRNNQTVIGQYNTEKNNCLFIVGNGTSNSNRKNAFEIDQDGNAVIAATLTIGTNLLVQGQTTLKGNIILNSNSYGTVDLNDIQNPIEGQIYFKKIE